MEEIKNKQMEEKEVVSDLRQLENTIQTLSEKTIEISNNIALVLNTIKGGVGCVQQESDMKTDSVRERGENRIVEAKINIEEVMNYLATITRNVNCIGGITD